MSHPSALARWLAIGHQQIGWPGWAGLLLIGGALVLVLRAPSPLQANGADDAAAPAPAATALPVLHRPATEAPALAPASAVPALLRRIEQAAQAQGIAWPAAEYRIAPASAQRPASLEVRSQLEAPYPALRALLHQLALTLPAFTLRELAFARQHGDAAVVEARLRLVIYLADEGAPDRPNGPADTEAPAGQAFAVRTAPGSLVPAPAPARAASPAAPAAPAPAEPAPPLQVIGTWDDAAGPAAFVASPGGTWLARPGTVLLAEYRVTALTAQHLTLLHLPSQREIRIALPRASGT
ncbi:hypothetical protein [Pseudaquabacterium terrae]|uniref:hypothetical protein n=1 Tax=Pseudaquabacterium terrae TaxID=2732868 RepID=UPI001C269005|nr:hypothetical protein [Aquabacterium terrae]